MILDKENMFSWKQAVTVSAPSTNVVDLGPNHWANASGSDREIPIFLSVDETFTAAGAATLTVQVQSSNAENMAGAQTDWEKTFALADLTDLSRMPLSVGIPADVKRYVRLNYVVATGPFTAGIISAGVTASRQTNY